jgi:hypothetical protein
MATTQTATTVTNATNILPTNKGQSAVDIATRYIGLIPYHLGAGVVSTRNLTAADCSSFVQFVYKQIGYTLPRAADAQYKATLKTAIPSPSTANLKPGDLLFFGGWNTPENPPGFGGVQHVGIYAGNGYVVDETSSRGNVGTVKLSDYGSHFLAATRPLGNSTTNSSLLADPSEFNNTETQAQILADYQLVMTKLQNGSADTFTKTDENTILAVAAMSGTHGATGTSLTSDQIATMKTQLDPIVGKPYSSSQLQIAGAFQAVGWSVTAIDTIEQTLNPLAGIAAILAKVVNPANWIHIGAMAAGVALIGFGLYMGSKDLGESGPQGLVSPMPIILKEGA